LEYVEEILKLAAEFKLFTFIDPHQDVWSRMTGGDGAPGWTLEKVGLDFTKFDVTGAALVMQYRYNHEDKNSYIPMQWIGNACRFANGTMWTIFFGGNDFAPSCRIGGQNARDYLQEHYFNAIKQVVTRVRDNPYVIGFDTLNEPNQGWIGSKVDGSNLEGFSEILGHAFTPLDAMLTGSGYTRTVGYREIKRFGIKETRRDDINKDKISCWLNHHDDIWKSADIWNVNENGEPVIGNNDYFMYREGTPINFYKDYLSPFIKDYSKKIREIIPQAIIFFEGPAEKLMRGELLDLDVPDNVVNAGHWYDVATLGTQRPMLKANFDTVSNKPVIGKHNIQKMFINQLRMIKDYSQKIKGGIPTLIGEFGIPYNLGSKKSYQVFKQDPKQAFNDHVRALSMYYDALDANLLHATHWNYTADNNNEWGDQWNLEDLSIFSRDQIIDKLDINSGGRAIEGFCRPRFVECIGIPMKMEFDVEKKIFTFEYNAIASVDHPTIIYVPRIQYPEGYKVEVSHGKVEYIEDEQLIKIYTEKNELNMIRIFKN
jgi:hypothetical protein